MHLQLMGMTINLKHSMRLLLFVLAGVTTVAATACGGQTREIFLDTLVVGVTTASNPEDVGGVSETYLIQITEGVEHYVYLGTPDGNIAGLWNANANDFIIQTNPQTESRTTTHTFSEGGFLKVFVRSEDSDIPSPFRFKIWAP